jgi:hypothetical protein
MKYLQNTGNAEAPAQCPGLFDSDVTVTRSLSAFMGGGEDVKLWSFSLREKG